MRKWLLGSLVLLISPALFGTDLLQVYLDSLQNSPLPETYLATQNSTKEGTPIALGALLPQLAITANGTYTDAIAPGADYNYPSAAYSLTLTQPLFNYSNYATLAGAMDNSSSAEATYQSNMQNFILTVATNYFNVILAEYNVRFAEAEIASLKLTLEQTKAKFSVGIATITDVLQAEANYESAKATLIANQNTLNDSNQTLMELTGKVEPNLALIQPDFPFTPPEPNDIDAWVAHAIQNNQSLIAQRYTTKSALATVNEAVGSQLPSVNLELAYGNTYYQNDISPVISASPRPMTASIALDLTWNVFSGGEEMATTLQDANMYASSQNVELNLYRQTTMQTKQDFLSVIANIAQVESYKQSLIAAQSTLNDYNAKYKVGTATIVDVLNATQTLYQTKSSLASAAYQYIISLLQLKFDAGTLNQQDLVSLNQYLQVAQ